MRNLSASLCLSVSLGISLVLAGVLARAQVAAAAPAALTPAGEREFPGEPPPGDVVNDLSDEQERTALELLDDICGDTWCEGSYDWRFEDLTCDFAAGNCTLALLAREYSEPPVIEPLVCSLEDLHGYDELVEDTGSDPSLVWSFYEKVGACIDSFEDAQA